MASKAEYLSGNGAAIKNFIDKFDVRLQSAAKNDPDKEHSISCSTAMVRQSKALIDGFTLRARSRGLTKLPAEIAQRIGVLWSGDHLFEGTVETLEKLKSHGMFQRTIIHLGRELRDSIQARRSSSSPTTAPNPAPTTRRSSQGWASLPR